MDQNLIARMHTSQECILLKNSYFQLLMLMWHYMPMNYEHIDTCSLMVYVATNFFYKISIIFIAKLKLTWSERVGPCYLPTASSISIFRNLFSCLIFKIEKRIPDRWTCKAVFRRSVYLLQ